MKNLSKMNLIYYKGMLPIITDDIDLADNYLGTLDMVPSRELTDTIKHIRTLIELKRVLLMAIQIQEN